MPSTPSLVERKQQRARQRIVAAANELFAARGFDDVSVADIAERAEVGRTTFFRHFGDKQEVVFAREQELLDLVSAEHDRAVARGDGSLREAVESVEALVLRLCELISADADAYAEHLRIVERSAELRARDAAKTQLIGRRLSALLVERGWDEEVAALAGQIGLACYLTARDVGVPAELVTATRGAFARVLSIGADRGAEPRRATGGREKAPS